MRVKIGPYKDWIGVYQIANWLRHLGFSHSVCEYVGDFLSEQEWLVKNLKEIDDLRSRKEDVTIHNYDIWSMDHTLSLIILPMLINIRADKIGCPYVEAEDVPESLRIESEDGYHPQRWDWVLGEMIWVFTNIKAGDKHSEYYDGETLNMEKLDLYNERMTNGLRLFGKYFRALWT